MSISENSLRSIKLKPIISYPREAEVGKSYLMTLDVQLESPDTPWPYSEEEYTISFVLDTSPFFSYEPLGGREPSIVLHRFGGTYGPAEYLLTAAQEVIAQGEINITFVNGWGIPIASLSLKCEVKREVIADPTHEIIFARREKDSYKQEQKSEEKEPIAQYGVAHYGVDHYEASREPAVKDSTTLIETQLRLTGWNVLPYENLETDTTQNLAIRTFTEDYVLVIDGKLIGMVRIRPIGEPIAGVEEALLPSQIQDQVRELKINITNRALSFVYETSGYETHFTNYLEPEPRSRAVFTFHRPETLRTWLKQAPPDVPATMNDLLRSRLRRMPPSYNPDLRKPQLEAITNLERSLAENRPRALIQMGVGSGKTYMTVNSIYRLLKFGGAHRILYLVDRSVLARQAMDAFQQFVTPDDGRRFTDLYTVQLPINNDINPTADVCIVTIQRLYSIFTNQPSIDDLVDNEASTVDKEDFDAHISLKEVQYKPEIPIEFFDFIIIDECHRSIYQQWRPVLEYFDAFLIGLTATPNPRTLTFFDKNLIVTYNFEQASQFHTKPAHVFLAFAYEDRSFYEDLVTQLAPLRRVGMIDNWHEYEIPLAKDWQQIENERLAQADIILLLISPNFIASDYYYSVQMKQALERDASGQARVLLILCRPVSLASLPIDRQQFLPRSDQHKVKAVNQWSNKESAYAEVVEEVKKAITQLFGASPGQVPLQPETAAQPQGTRYLTYTGHASYLISAAWSPDGKYIASGGGDNTVRVWDAYTGNTLYTYRVKDKKSPYDPGFVAEVWEIIWSPDSTSIAFAGRESPIVWSPQDNQVLATYKGHPPVRIIASMDWSPDGQYIATTNLGGFFDPNIHIWGSATGQLFAKIRMSSNITISIGGVAWSPDSKRIACGWRGEVRIYDVYTRQLVQTYKNASDSSYFNVCWSRDGSRLVCGVPKEAVVWDTATGKLLHKYVAHKADIRDLAISPDGRYVASASNDTTVHIWETDTGKHVYTYFGHKDQVASVTWSPDGTRIASACKDGTVHVWQAF